MKTSICLNMIVKNESRIIERCLASVKPYIDTWVIADTGSTDGTQTIIRQFMQDIPGTLYERPWVDFGHNRNEVLNLSKGKAEYLLFLDADERLVPTESFVFPPLEHDCYFAKTHQENGSSYYRIFTIKSSLNWRWEGVIHEELVCSEIKSKAILDGIINLSISSDGYRFQDPNKYLKDALLLETLPPNGRNLLFLALSYEKAGLYESALKTYQKRVDLGGWEEEVFYALYRIASTQPLLKMDPKIFIQSYLDAHQYRPTRAEPLYWAAHYFMTQRNYHQGYLLAQRALYISRPNDTVYVEDSLYDYNILYQFAVCSSQIGKHSEAHLAYLKLSTNKNLPAEKRLTLKE